MLFMTFSVHCQILVCDIINILTTVQQTCNTHLLSFCLSLSHTISLSLPLCLSLPSYLSLNNRLIYSLLILTTVYQRTRFETSLFTKYLRSIRSYSTKLRKTADQRVNKFYSLWIFSIACLLSLS